MRVTKKLVERFGADIAASQAKPFPDVFEIDGKRFLILKGVFNPLFYDSTEFFAQRLPFPIGMKFFEVGIGSGAIAVNAVLRGCSFARGIDINAEAVYNSDLNARLHCVETKVAFEVMDVKDLQDFSESSLVFWAHPWVNSSILSEFGVLGRSIMDPYYCGLEKFAALAGGSFNSRVFLGFGNTGDYRKLNEICQKHGLQIEVFAEGISSFDNRYTYQLLELLRSRGRE